VDQPIATMIRDLKPRGLLDSTVVIWAGEFGRTPFASGTPVGQRRKSTATIVGDVFSAHRAVRQERRLDDHLRIGVAAAKDDIF
jgi:hypothetical protein